jgi:peptide/nickel transport system substrate-binding protein
MMDSVTVGGPEPERKSIGTGPWQFVEWQQGSHVQFRKNPNYWDAGKPYLNELRYNIFADTAAMVASFEGGALDAILRMPTRDFVRLKADPKYTTAQNDVSGEPYLIGLSLQKAPTTNKDLRQAMAWSLDRARFTETVLQNTSKPSALPWQPGSQAYEASKESFYTFDLDKARAALAKSGLTNPEINIIHHHQDTQAGAMAQIFQADLARIGVRPVIQALEPAAYNAATRTAEGWNAVITNTHYAMLQPSSIAALSFYFGTQSNRLGFSNAKYTEVVNQMGAEADPVKRKALISQFNDIILDESPILFFSNNLPRVVAKASVNAVSYNMLPGINFNNAWMNA